MRFAAARYLSRAPSIVLALASSSSLTSFTTTTTAFIPSSVSALRTFPLVANTGIDTLRSTSFCTNLRGGSILNASSSSGGSVNGENSEGNKKVENSSEPATSNKNQRKPPGTERPSTGWTHSLPKESSEFWTGAKELPKKEAPDIYKSGNTRSGEKRKTGWLHNTSKEKAAASTSGNQAKSSTGNKARKLLEQAMLDQKINHRIISPPSFHAVSEGRRAVITEHKLCVPLDRSKSPKDPKDPEPMIDVYFSIVELITSPEQESFFQSLQATAPGATLQVKKREMTKRASDYRAFAKLNDAEDCILYLQGGPGFGAPTPITGIGLSEQSSWVGAAFSKGFKRVILMDQRGTGRSTTITKQTLEKRFPDLFLLDGHLDHVKDTVSTIATVEEELASCSEGEQEQNADKVRAALKEATDYMSLFRADNIVKDAEAIKDVLLFPYDVDGDDEKIELPPRPWGAALGQSFGGFCMMTYLSLISNPPKICLLTGGIAPMLTNVDDVYKALRGRVKERNAKYYDRYPGDVDVVKRIVRRLASNPPKLPSGGVLTPRRFLQIGIGLGGSPSAFASIHSLLASAFISDEDDDLSRAFLKAMDSEQPFDDHPIYFLMHESIYADSNSDCETTNWSAYRAYEPDNAFDLKTSCESECDDPTLLTGEVVFPWMADGDYAELSGFGMRALAQSLADKNDWGCLYDCDNMRKALSLDGTGISKAAAAIYYDDMYVDFDAAIKVTRRGNPLENCKVWISNEYQHSGLRDDGAMIFNKLLGMAKGEVGTPS